MPASYQSLGSEERLSLVRGRQPRRQITVEDLPPISDPNTRYFYPTFSSTESSVNPSESGRRALDFDDTASVYDPPLSPTPIEWQTEDLAAYDMRSVTWCRTYTKKEILSIMAARWILADYEMDDLPEESKVLIQKADLYRAIVKVMRLQNISPPQEYVNEAASSDPSMTDHVERFARQTYYQFLLSTTEHPSSTSYPYLILDIFKDNPTSAVWSSVPSASRPEPLPFMLRARLPLHLISNHQADEDAHLLVGSEGERE